MYGMLDSKIVTNHITFLTNWAKLAQKENYDLRMAECDKLSNEVIDSEDAAWYTVFDPWVGAGQTTASERSNCKDNIDTAWIIVQIDALINQYQLAQTETDQSKTLGKIDSWIVNNEKHFPNSYKEYRKYIDELPKEVKKEIAPPKLNTDWKAYGVAGGMAVLGMATAYVITERMAYKAGRLPQRENPFFLGIPAAIAGLGLVKGVLATAAIGLTLGGGVALATSATYTPNLADSFDNLEGKIQTLKDKISLGFYQGDRQNINMFLSQIGWGTSMRMCAFTAEQAKEQTIFVLYACAYATGDAKYIEKAEEYENTGGWFGNEEKFTDFNAAEQQMKSVLALMRQDSNPLVRNMTTSFTLLSTAACMQETDRSLQIQTEGSPNAPCAGLSIDEKIWQVLDGLFFLGPRPCMMSKLKWRKTRIMVYTPMVLFSLPYILPVAKPIGMIVKKGLDNLARPDED